MKIAFFVNHFIHHQEPLSLELYKLTNGNFYYVAYQPLPEERLKLGYEDMNKKYDFIIRPYESEEQKKLAEKIAVECDIMVAGGATYYSDLRRKSGNDKIIIQYSERFFKKGRYRILFHKLLKKDKEWFNLSKKKLPENENTYVLCASAYTSYDLKPFNFDVGKCFKWGYFTELIEYDIDVLMKNKQSDIVNILWCGRFIDWKHPEKAIFVAKKLKEKKINFKLNMVGNGKQIEKIRKLIRINNLESEVKLIGSVPASEVRKYMEKSNIFLFTSDFNEGWGAVLNESMNSGCAVVASHAIGSVPYLIEDGKNGFIYKNNDNNDLFNKVYELCINNELRESLGKNAYYAMKNLWNPEVAAKRLYNTAKNFMDSKKIDFYNEGPWSKAEIIKNNWYK